MDYFNNSLFAGMILSALIMRVKEMPVSIFNFLLDLISTRVTYTVGPGAIEQFRMLTEADWFHVFGNNYSRITRTHLVDGRPEGRVHLLPKFGYALIRVDGVFALNANSGHTKRPGNQNPQDFQTYIRYFCNAEKAAKIQHLISRNAALCGALNGNRNYITISGPNRSGMGEFTPRQPHTQFYQDDVYDNLKKHITTSNPRLTVLKEAGMSPGIMHVLYGAPGVGKSTLIRSLAIDIGASLVYVDLNAFFAEKPESAKRADVNNASLLEVIAHEIERLVNQYVFIVIDDLDRQLEKFSEGVNVLPSLLKLMDGVGLRPGTHLLVTVNSVDKIPRVAFRPGRVASMLEVKQLDVTRQLDMVREFIPDAVDAVVQSQCLRPIGVALVESAVVAEAISPGSFAEAYLDGLNRMNETLLN